jgi:glutamate dehydrogenase
VDDDYVARALVAYFPRPLQSRYPEVIPRHPLRREIVATGVANTMINRTGPVFVQRMQDETGAKAEEVVRAFILVRDIFGLESLWAEIDALDNRVPAALQSELLVDAGRLVVRGALWFLRRRREKFAIARVLEIFQPGLAALQAKLPAALSAGDRAAWEAYVARLSAEGVPGALAERMAALDALYAVLDVTEVALELGKPIEAIASLYFSLVGELELRWFGERITALPTDTPWQALARNALRDDLSSQQRTLTQSVARLAGDSTDPEAMLSAWRERYAPAIARLKGMTEELRRGTSVDLAMLSVLLRELRSLA